MHGTALLLGLVAALALSACSKQEPDITANDQVPAAQHTEMMAEGETPAQAGPPVFVAIDIDYEAAPTELPAGEVEITLDNKGAIEHNVTLIGPGYDEEVVLVAGAGASATETVTLEPGTYEYHCSIPGHEANMHGELTVN